jgi:hypothetical protein
VCPGGIQDDPVKFTRHESDIIFAWSKTAPDEPGIVMLPPSVDAVVDDTFNTFMPEDRLPSLLNPVTVKLEAVKELEKLAVVPFIP